MKFFCGHPVCLNSLVISLLCSKRSFLFLFYLTYVIARVVWIWIWRSWRCKVRESWRLDLSYNLELQKLGQVVEDWEEDDGKDVDQGRPRLRELKQFISFSKMFWLKTERVKSTETKNCKMLWQKTCNFKVHWFYCLAA